LKLHFNITLTSAQFVDVVCIAQFVNAVCIAQFVDAVCIAQFVTAPHSLNLNGQVSALLMRAAMTLPPADFRNKTILSIIMREKVKLNYLTGILFPLQRI
jgi:hypothetical protein